MESLGSRYPAVLASCDVVVGNSSSGVIEAASVGVPAVDIGPRQHGRLRSDNVFWSDEGEAAVGEALRHVLADDFRSEPPAWSTRTATARPPAASSMWS